MEKAAHLQVFAFIKRILVKKTVFLQVSSGLLLCAPLLLTCVTNAEKLDDARCSPGSEKPAECDGAARFGPYGSYS